MTQASSQKPYGLGASESDVAPVNNPAKYIRAYGRPTSGPVVELIGRVLGQGKGLLKNCVARNNLG